MLLKEILINGMKLLTEWNHYNKKHQIGVFLFLLAIYDKII